MKEKKSCVPFLVSFSSFPVPSISGNGGFFNTPEKFKKQTNFNMRQATCLKDEVLKFQ